MKRPTLFLIIPVFFSCFFSRLDSGSDPSFAFNCSFEDFTTTQKNLDGSIVWHSENGRCQLEVSAHQRTKHHAHSHSASYVQQNYSKFKNFKHRKEWHTFFAELTNVPPKDWIESDRKDLFYKFELYQHWTYKYFLQSFPEFEERIVELDELSRQDKDFREQLNNHYMTYKWFGLKGGKSVADYIKEQLSRARKFLRDRQTQKERKEQSRIFQQKIKSKDPVRELFLGQVDEIDSYKRELAESPRGTVNERFLCRNQKRAAAIQEAINNNFKILIQRYQLSSQASCLLQQHNIDSEIFKECVGNTIQQQLHAEFVEILNNGTDLYSQRSGLPGVALLVSEDWFSVLSNYSSVGVQVNVLGRYSLAHKISDICQGIYEIGKKATHSQYDKQFGSTSIESLWNAAVEYVEGVVQHIGYVTKTAGDSVVDFTEGVQDKALGRAARFIAEFAHMLQSNPEIIFKKASGIIIGTAQCALETTQLIETLTKSPFSEQTQQFLDNFEREWVGPFRKKVTKAAQTFWQMPPEEKAQEVVALGLQVFAIVGAAKLIAALPAQAALFKASALLKLDQFSQTIGPVMQTGISPDGTVNIALQAVEQMSEELVAVAEEAITIAAGVQAELATTAVVDAVCTTALAVRDGGSGTMAGGKGSRTPRLEKKVRVAREKAKKTRRRNICAPKEIIREWKRLAGRDIEWTGTFDRTKVKKIDLPEKMIFSEDSLEHVFSGKVEVPTTNAPLKISGYHSDFKGRAFDQSGMNMTKIRDPQTGAITAKVRLCGKTTIKTLFPENLTPKEVLDITHNAMRNVYEIKSQKYGRLRFRGMAENGMKIELITEASGEVVTFYPWLKGS